jgi:hypothetical protein
MENPTNTTTDGIIKVNNASKYVVLPDGRMARLLKPVKVKKYQYYSFITDDKKARRVNLDDIRNINNVLDETK